MTIATRTDTIKTPAQAVPRRRGCLFYLKRGLLTLLIVIIVLPLSGFVYETIMAAGDAQRFPAPGQLVTVNGVQMHLRCEGEGSPTIILEAGFGSWSDSWSLVQPAVSNLTRVCSYDQAGVGWSAPSSQPRTQQQLAAELHDLLAAAHVQPPYILIGHSLGGKSIRLFVAQHPEEVVGIVFVDARHESVEPTGRTPEQNTADRAAFESSLNFYRVLRQTGIRMFAVPVARMIDPSMKNLPDDLVYRQVIFAMRETTLQTEAAESREATANDAQLAAVRVPDGIPVVVLTADSSLENLDNWKQGQEKLVALSSNSQWVIVKNSSHNIQSDQPQAVIDAVQRVLDAVRTGQPVPQ